MARLPFIADPVANLKSNRHIAEKILTTQVNQVMKSPDIRTDVLKSFDKLYTNGHIIEISKLSQSEKIRMADSISGPGYYIPWRTVFKSNSLSTPCRMVYDASSRTPGGDSLNGVLAKGQNLLINIFHILIRFMSKPYAVSGDVRMAYNGIKLEPEFYQYQKFLWRKDLDPSNPIEEMIVRTLIYGVRSSGNQTSAGFGLLADHVMKNYDEHALGAKAVSEDAYVDDILSSYLTESDREKAMDGIAFTLSCGSMTVKDFVTSGSNPSELVSSDTETVGLVGYTWKPKDDLIAVNVKDLFLGKVKRGIVPPKVTGDIDDALKPYFTRRTLVSKVAGVFDPMGKVSPITSRFKLDLHELLQYSTGWDDPLPEELLPRWVENLKIIQNLRDVWFRRAFVPIRSDIQDVELIISTDASQTIAAACGHLRVMKPDKTYECQLIASKTKLVKYATIPKAELRACVIGATLSHVIKKNLSHYNVKTKFVTDSTVSLYWLSSDQRPLQLGTRNSVIEIRRFSSPDDWYHVDSQNNIADL